jgi:HEAT repeat protein
MTFEELHAALKTPQAPEHRKPFLQALVDLRDPRAADVFREGLRSDDEEIRAMSATGLAGLGAEDAIAACLAVINDAPDPLHHDVTPAVVALAEMGVRALPSILRLLDSPDPLTRQRAQKVLERVTLSEVSEEAKPRALSGTAAAQWSALWAGNGSYQWDAPETQRRAAIERWRQWIVGRARLPLSP